MGLNGVRNGSKLNRIAGIVGAPVLIAYSRYFDNQNDLLAFTQEDEPWIVNMKAGTGERYTEPVVLFRAQDGDYGGVRSLAPPLPINPAKSVPVEIDMDDDDGA